MIRSSKLMLASLVLLAACREPSSPFKLWEMRAGMPFATLDSIALHGQKERFNCVDSYGSFRACSLQALGAFGMVEAIVDSADRAVVISFKPSTAQMAGYNDMIAGLQFEAREVRAGWNLITQGHPDPQHRPPARGENWMSEDGRWGASMVWGADGFVDEFRTYDAHAVRAWDVLAARARTDSLTRADAQALQVTESRTDPAVILNLVRMDLERLVDAQISYHDTKRDYADNTQQLNFASRPKIDITIGGADPFGWWARATHRSLPERGCTVWMGEAPNRPSGLGPRGGEPVCS
jgi:hypothetical protein